MPAKNDDLHGNVPDHSPVALVLIDVVNDFDFETGQALLENALPIAERLAELKKRCAEAGIPAIYANDNFGRWRSDKDALLKHCLSERAAGHDFVRRLLPGEEDYFVLKPKHSAFYSTTLDLLLLYLNVRTVIMTGLTGDICVLFSANDAYLRDYHLIVPSDCIASADEGENRHALAHMQRVLGADITPSTELDLSAITRETRRDSPRGS